MRPPSPKRDVSRQLGNLAGRRASHFKPQEQGRERAEREQIYVKKTVKTDSKRLGKSRGCAEGIKPCSEHLAQKERAGGGELGLHLVLSSERKR